MADWGCGIDILHRGSHCSLGRTMDGHIMRGGIISSYQSAATSEIVALAGREFDSCKQRYSKLSNLYLYLYLLCNYIYRTEVILHLYLTVECHHISQFRLVMGEDNLDAF